MMTIDELKHKLIKELKCEEHKVIEFLKEKKYDLEDNSIIIKHNDYEYLKFMLEADIELLKHMQELHQKHIEEMEDELFLDELEEKRLEEEEKIERKNRYDANDYGNHDSTTGWDKSNQWNID